MKKKVLAMLVTVAVVATMVGCGNNATQTEAVNNGNESTSSETTEIVDDTSAKDGLKIGLAIQTLGNQVWAQQMDAIQRAADKDGNQAVVVECNENANTQIDQLENFITSGCDIIVVNPVDPDAIETVCAKAREAGIIVIAWDEEMENTDINWIIKNYDLGAAIGEEAAKFIHEKYGDEGCEVAVLGYPQTPILLERENGILDKIAELAPNAVVVANQPAINPTEGLNAMETILQAYPNVKVVCSIGGGGAAGANEAFKGFYGTEVPDNVGVFSTDLTDETVSSMQNGEFNRMCVAITGNAYVCGEEVYDIAIRYAKGEAIEQNVYRDLIPVTIANLSEMISD